VLQADERQARPHLVDQRSHLAGEGWLAQDHVDLGPVLAEQGKTGAPVGCFHHPAPGGHQARAKPFAVARI
jgi:hypothetical protein